MGLLVLEQPPLLHVTTDQISPTRLSTPTLTQALTQTLTLPHSGLPPTLQPRHLQLLLGALYGDGLPLRCVCVLQRSRPAGPTQPHCLRCLPLLPLQPGVRTRRRNKERVWTREEKQKRSSERNVILSGVGC